MRNLTCSTSKGPWNGISLTVVYACVDLICILCRVRRLYSRGCLPTEKLGVLTGYEGQFKDKVRTFVSDYCRHLASSHETGVDPVRHQNLLAFLGGLKM